MQENLAEILKLLDTTFSWLLLSLGVTRLHMLRVQELSSWSSSRPFANLEILLL